jgi:hypothetical protein
MASRFTPQKPYSITVTDDETEAWICFQTDAPLPLAQVQDDLAAAGVRAGIDDFLLRDLAEARQPGCRYRIAQAIPPEEGLEFSFTLHQERTPRRLPDGRVDFYNLDAIQNVVQQQILVSKIPPDACKPGCTVTGKVIAPLRRDLPLPEPGNNVMMSDDGQALIALINGHPVFQDNQLHVQPMYVHDGDVDVSVGHLTCIGHLVITGDVKCGFTVKGAQQVTVHGVVDGGAVEAEGDVCLYGNVFGQQKGRIWTAENVYGSYVDAAYVEAQRDIVLTRGARRSVLKAGGSIIVRGEASSIMGGTARACERIVSSDLGCDREIPTRLEIVSGVFDEATCLRFLRQMARVVEADSAWIGASPGAPQGSATGVTLQQTLPHCQVGLEYLKQYFMHRQKVSAIAPRPLGVIIATGTVYPGVTICIGDASMLVTHAKKHVLFFQHEGVIQIQPLEQRRMDDVCVE